MSLPYYLVEGLCQRPLPSWALVEIGKMFGLLPPEASTFSGKYSQVRSRVLERLDLEFPGWEEGALPGAAKKSPEEKCEWLLEYWSRQTVRNAAARAVVNRKIEEWRRRLKKELENE